MESTLSAMGGLAYGSALVPSPLSIAVNNSPGGVVDVPAVSQVVSGPVPLQYSLPGYPGGGTGAKWLSYVIGRYGYVVFGIGVNIAGKFAFTPLVLTNLLPVPLGVVPPSVYGLPSNWLQLGAEEVLKLLQAQDDAAVQATIATDVNQVQGDNLAPIPVDVQEFNNAGLIVNGFKGWLVDP